MLRTCTNSRKLQRKRCVRYQVAESSLQQGIHAINHAFGIKQVRTVWAHKQSEIKWCEGSSSHQLSGFKEKNPLPRSSSVYTSYGNPNGDWVWLDLSLRTLQRISSWSWRVRVPWFFKIIQVWTPFTISIKRGLRNISIMFWATKHHSKGIVVFNFPFSKMGKGWELNENIIDSFLLYVWSKNVRIILLIILVNTQSPKWETSFNIAPWEWKKKKYTPASIAYLHTFAYFKVKHPLSNLCFSLLSL